MRWTPAEDAKLHLLCGDVPWPMVVCEMRRSARINGWPARTQSAIEARISNLGITRVCNGQWTTVEAIARTLKRDRRTILAWIDKGELAMKRINRICWVKRSELRKFAKSKPRLFAGLTQGELFCLLDNEMVAAEIAAMGLKRVPIAKPVVCVETGWRYPSAAAAARANYLAPETVRGAIRTGRTAGGRHYRKI